MGNNFFQKIGISVMLFTFLILPLNGWAQVGIGTTNPNSNALLELDATATPGGLLMPRIALTSTTNFAPLSAHVPGMTVYNTAAAGSGANAVSPGYYYNNGSQWVRLAADTDAKNNWNLTGNSDTDPTVNFLGTKDNQPLVIRTDGSERMRVLPDGRVTVNSDLPFGGVVFNSFAAGNNDAIAGSAIDGSGVYGQATGTGVGLVAVGGGNIASIYFSVGAAMTGPRFGGIGFSRNSGNGTGLVGLGNAGNTIISLNSGSGIAGSGDTGVFGYSITTQGTGVIGAGNNGDIYTLIDGSGVAGTGNSNGVYGHAMHGVATSANDGNSGGYFSLGTTADPNSPIRAFASIAGYHRGEVPPGSGTHNYYGGYFEGGRGTFNSDPSYAYVGIKTGASGSGTGGINYKIIGTGNNSTLIDDNEGNKRVLFSPEAPEIIFEDYGVGQLVGGSVYIEIDPLFAKAIHVSEKHPLKVFIQLEGECNGVYVTEKTANGFLVKELNGGSSNTPFSYHLVANRADDIASDGSISSKHVGLRFPLGPERLEMAEMKTVEVKKAKSKSLEQKILTRGDNEAQTSEIQQINSETTPEVQQFKTKIPETQENK